MARGKPLRLFGPGTGPLRDRSVTPGDLIRALKTADNTVKALVSPVSRFLHHHLGLEEGQPLPIGDQLLEKLEEAVEAAVTEAMGTPPHAQ